MVVAPWTALALRVPSRDLLRGRCVHLEVGQWLDRDALVETLMAAGCPVEYKCYPGMIHGFARMGAKVDAALIALDDACGVLREIFGVGAS